MSDPQAAPEAQPDNTLRTRIRAAISDARRELIDLTRRNRLLNSPRTGKRPHCLETIGMDVDHLFGVLTRESGRFRFLADDIEASSERSVSPRKRLVRLQTKLAAKVLDRRLLKLYREARTFEEEQGVNILFLAVGFLKWFEDDRSEEPNWAPLILVDQI